MISPVSQEAISLDDAIFEWRQGDFVLGNDVSFLHLADLKFPLTNEAQQTAQQLLQEGEELSIEGVFSDVVGLVVLTQTCDIVRMHTERPFIDVAPLILIDDPKIMDEISKRRKPRYAYLPGASSHSMVVDLDRIMTLEKTIMASWNRNQGCTNDLEVRQFSEQLIRKVSRFAFPTDFVTSFSPAARWVNKRHGKDSPTGKMLEALREIRIRATPSWNAEEVKLTFWFIKEDNDSSPEYNWNDFFDEFKQKFESSGRFTIEKCVALTPDDMSLRQYLQSDKFDFDQLSHPKSETE